jgi:hypothetical protein
MTFKYRPFAALVLTITTLVLVSTRLPADTGTCGGAMVTLPFTDVSGNIFFCQIAEAYFSGLTLGTTPTTYSPDDFVRRDQMAAFVTRTQDGVLRRASRRAALSQWAFPHQLPMTAKTPIGIGSRPQGVRSDGADLWVAGFGNHTVTRVRASDGLVLGTWTGATNAVAVLIARGRVYVTGQTNPAALYVLDPRTFPGAVTTVSNSLVGAPLDMTTDGDFIWIANSGGPVSKVNPDTGNTTNISPGFGTVIGILFDGVNIWATDNTDHLLKRLDSAGNVLQSVPVGLNSRFPVFDGSNIWVPNGGSNSLTVVRARDGVVMATLTGNGLSDPFQCAFDGERILVTNAQSVSMWRATDLTAIGTFPTAAATANGYVCSDGINFWITSDFTGELWRF